MKKKQTKQYLSNLNISAIFKLVACEVEHLALTYLHTAGVQGQQMGCNYPRNGVAGKHTANPALLFLSSINQNKSTYPLRRYYS